MFLCTHFDGVPGIAKGSKVDAVKMMPPPRDVSGLRSFLGSVHFYGKFLPNLATITEPLHCLRKKDIAWSWGAEEQEAFQKLKDLLCTDTIVVHFNFNPSLMLQRWSWELFSSTVTVMAVSTQSPMPLRPSQTPSSIRCTGHRLEQYRKARHGSRIGGLCPNDPNRMSIYTHSLI